MNKNLLFALILLSQISIAQTPCSGGMAGSYPCNGITLQSYISASTMGGGEGQDSWGWTDPLDGKEYAIVGLDNGTAFVNITNPVSPIYLGRLNSHTGTSLWRDVKVFNNYAYIVSDSNGNHGMQIFDLTRLRSVASPPTTFTEDGWETWGTSGSNRGRAHNIIINEDTGYAYVSGVSPYISGGLVIFNLNIDPENPSIVATYSTGGYCHDAQVVIYDGPDPDYQGREILIGSFSGSDFLRILDVTNKTSISQISSIDYSNKYYTHQGWFTEDKRFFIVGDEVDEENVGFNTRTLVFDLQDLDNPVLHYTYFGPTSAIDHNGYVRGNRFYLANYAAGMRILKIDGLYDAIPSMTEVNFFDTYPASNSASFNATWNVYPFFESGNLIATGFGNENILGDGGLFVLRDPNYDNIDPVVVCQNITATLNKITGTVTIDALDVDGGSTDNIGITERTISGQTTFTCADVGNTFNVTLTIKDDYGNTASCVATVTVAAETTTHLGGGTWSNGAPDVGSNAKISSDYNTSSFGSIDACTCEVDATRTLTINADDYLKTEQDITVNGTLVVEHQGNVVQTDPAASVIKNGTINVNVTSPDLKKRDFMLMGSPMTTESRIGVWNTAFLVLNFNSQNFLPHPDVPAGGTNFADDNGDFYSIYSGAINPGEGYVVRPQSGYNDPTVPPTGRPFLFTYELGTLNNGDITYTNYNNGPAANPNGTPNMVANPYASAIDGDIFMATNGIGALYFWEHLTPPGAPLSGSNLRFDMDDLSIYNGVMGIPAANDPGNAQGTAPNGIIATAQGFGIRTSGTAGTSGTITFNNTMRLTSGNNTLRTATPSSDVAQTEKLIIEIREKAYGFGSFTGIAFNENATSGYDDGYDTNRLATVVSIFSELNDGTGEFGIQTLGSFTNDEKIPLGFATQIDELLEYEISLTSLEGVNLENTKVYLYDRQDNKIISLENKSYTFKSGKGFFNDRFTLLFKSERILGPEETSLDSIALFPNPAKNHINIFSPDTYLVNLEVYDLMGRKISQRIEDESNTFSLDLSNLKTGVYFIKIDTEKGTVTKKIIKE
ncbi:MAG: choice-of-anchor B family protein [Flavobacteriaceae bacterium]|nr:choice-of-anchor B family protein [Flavobacteriaceae bacterium]